MKLSELIANSGNIPESLIRAVVRQSGGWSDFKEMAEDVTNHGADCGFGGWTYYSDTVKFAKANRKAIAELSADMASEFDMGTLEMIQGFNCIGTEYSLDEIGRCLYGSGDETTILNGLAWFSLEEVARAYRDAVEAK